MNSSLPLSNADHSTGRYPSLAALRAVHSNLLKRNRDSGLTDQLLSEVKNFIFQGRETGVLLDIDEDRWAAQSLLDYWNSLLYREGHEPPDATLADFDAALAPELDDSLCPYLGLESFHEDNRRFFWGRQRLLDRLIDHLSENQLLAVVGSSGSGKSSVVLGGLLPSLRDGKLLDSDKWHYYSAMVPGSDPLTNLVRLIQPETTSITEIGQLNDRLKVNPKALAELLRNTDTLPAVLVIDQFEEIFTLCRDDKIREAFIDNLLGLIRAPGVRNIVILTMRTDFESRVAQLDDFQSVFEAAQVRVTAMDAGELRVAVEKPAELVGLKFEEGIVDALLGEVLGEPAALPLLQFTLLKLWHNRERNRVTWETYKRLGGGRLALARSADACYNELIPEDQVTARRILLRMVRPTQGLEATSNRIPKKDLYRVGEAPDRVDRVLEKLIQAGLIRSNRGKSSEDDQIEVAHEALVRNWPRLVDWLDEERVNMRNRLRLNDYAAKWLEERKDRNALLRGNFLAEALTYPDLNESENEFVQCSLKEEQKTKNALLTLRVLLFLIAAAVLGCISYLISLKLRESNLYEKASRVNNLLNTQPVEGLVLAIEAIGDENSSVWKMPWDRDSELQVHSSLLASLQETREFNRLIGHDDKVNSVAVSSNGKLIVSGGDDRTVRLWDNSGKKLGVGTLSNSLEQITSVAINSDGRTIISASRQGTILSWELIGNKLNPVVLIKSSKEKISKRMERSINSVAISDDGKVLVSGGNDKKLDLWKLENNKIVNIWSKENNEPINSVAISKDGKTIVSGDGNNYLATTDGAVRLWDSKGETIAKLLKGHVGPIKSVAISENGQFIVSGGWDRKIILWDHQGKSKNNEGRDISPPLVHRGQVMSVAISADEQTIISGSDDGTVQLWDRNGQPINTNIGHGLSVSSVAISPNGQTIISGSSDRTVRLWTREKIIQTSMEKATNSSKIMAISIGNRNIVSTDLDTLHWKDQHEKAFSTKLKVPSKLKDHSKLNNSSRTIEKTLFPTALAITPDSQTIASGDFNGNIQVWNRQGKSVGKQFKGHDGFISAIALSPDGQTIVSAGYDQKIRLWNLQGVPIGDPLTNLKQLVRSLSINLDGQIIVTGTDDGTVQLWDRKGKSIGKPMTGHKNTVSAVAISADGQTIASGSYDVTVRLWTKEGQPIGRPFIGHKNFINSVAISPDGQTVRSGDFNGEVLQWFIGGWKDWLNEGCNQLINHPILIEHEYAGKICKKYKFNKSSNKLQANSAANQSNS